METCPTGRGSSDTRLTAEPAALREKEARSRPRPRALRPLQGADGRRGCSSSGVMRQRRIALLYNAYTEDQPELPEDRGGTADLRGQVREIARALRRLGYTVKLLP